MGQPSWASALPFFLGCPLPCCGEWGCGANLSRCANFPPLLAGISGHQAGTARAELNSKRLPKLASGSWPPTSVGREVTAEGAAEGGLLFSLCFGECLSLFWVFPTLKWIIQVCCKSVTLQGLVGCCKIRNKESAGAIGVVGNRYADAEVSLWCYAGPYITESKIRVSIHLFNYFH